MSRTTRAASGRSISYAVVALVATISMVFAGLVLPAIANAMAPTEDTITDVVTVPADETTTPPAEETMTPPAEETATPPAEETVPPAEEPATPPAEETVPAEEPATPPAEETVPAEEPATPPAEEPVPADSEPLLLDGDTLDLTPPLRSLLTRARSMDSDTRTRVSR